ncbi:MAG: DUF1285 domain-containing protein [Gammaproteobacteria bacterium]|nr:DUF1285 domain-containing protein [Gammaproteobacteria bacterium]
MKDSINPNSLFLNINDPSAPVDDWDPPYCGEIDICIHRDGRWSYNGSIFSRSKLVKMFSRVLKRENNDYYLVTPVEKVKITVEAEPFITVLVERNPQNPESYAFKTNMDETVVAGTEHPILVSEDQSGQPYPTILIRKNLHALICRSDYYQLVEWSTTEKHNEKNRCFIVSNNQRFTLGEF